MKTSVFKETVAKLDGQLDKLLEIAQSTETQEDIIKNIMKMKEKNQSENFKVLVMGEFSSGKSTMVNALIGEPVLPERATTATAIITEIKYGEEKKAVIYPKPGKWKGGDEPFEVPVTELRNYLLINHRIGENNGDDENTLEGNVIASPFEKAEIFMPLAILKDGVEVIDSPGLNDPASHGDITHKYLPNAHAIIFCMNGLKPYSETEMSTLEQLNSMHYETPILLLTRYDNVCEDYGGDEAEIEEYRKTVISDIKKHTALTSSEYTGKLGGSGIFFVSSRDAKRSKHTDPWNDELYEKSGYKEFERYLSDYLVKCKGDELSKMIVEGIKAVGNESINILTEQYNAAELSLDEFEERMHEVEAKMVSANEQAELFVKSFELELDKALDELKVVCKKLPEEAYKKIDEWKSSYKCSVKKDILHIKRTAEAIGKEFKMHMQNKYERFTVEWVETVLKVEVSARMKKIGEKLQNRALDLDKTINDIKVGLNYTSKADGEMGTTNSKVASVIYGLLTFDVIGASAGVAIGTEGLIKGIITNIGINLAIMAVFGSTVGLPVVIAGEVIQILLTGHMAKNDIERKMCEKIVKEYKKILSEPSEVERIVNNMYVQLETEFDKLKKEGKESAYIDIKRIELETKQLHEDKKNGEEAVKERKEKIESWISDIKEIMGASEQIRKDALGFDKESEDEVKSEVKVDAEVEADVELVSDVEVEAESEQE